MTVTSLVAALASRGPVPVVISCGDNAYSGGKVRRRRLVSVYNGWMPDQQTEPGAIVPLFSIIIPLEYHRGQWERCWEGWKSQTLDKTAYEIILVVPPDFSERDKLDGLATEARLEFADCHHDMGLSAIGARKAQGKYLLFTEAHCWPEADVLNLCLGAFQDHPSWSGFSCKAMGIYHNRLSVAEAAMYQTDIEFGMTAHPWRKILDQCFVTRRDVYEECGGLLPELGHFAEWVLAAAYHSRGHVIGYLDEARFHHYYVGALDDLKTFTLDFVQGEIRYFSEGSRGPGSELLEVSPEWSCQDNFDPEMARGIVRMTVTDMSGNLRLREVGSRASAISRWVWPALLGDGPARGASVVAAAYARLILMALTLYGSRESLARWMKIYITALIHYQRVSGIHAARQVAAKAATAVTRLGPDVIAQTGFYPLERWHDHAFRWSEPEAAIRIRAKPGHHHVRIECLPVRGPLHRVGMRFYLNDQPIADEAISTDADDFKIRLDLPESGCARLGWVGTRFSAAADPRRLGLPIIRIEVIPGPDSSQRTTLQLAVDG